MSNSVPLTGTVNYGTKIDACGLNRELFTQKDFLLAGWLLSTLSMHMGKDMTDWFLIYG